MIRLSGVCHQIGQSQILQDISAEIPRGKLTALIGPNGAGKSMLLRLIGRLEPIQTGTISVDDLDVAQTPSARLATHMAVLGQQTAIASRLRLAELVGFGRWPHHQGRPRPQDRQAVDAALNAFDLSSLAERFLDEVSGGQAQRAYLAMTFAQDTDWLLLDEPLNNLDMSHARALMARLSQSVRDSGKSVVVVVHEVNYAAAWANHIVALKNGRISAIGAPSEVLTSAGLSALYDTEIEVTEFRGRTLVLHH
ncbi:iron ABC transporter ATP-binding protein [Paracoccus aerodenitrificans]|uniref:iron ABC transporter ATP-binding protein n=1 Tax=Paracoccus aerodenitrificans TaxID=3017781 RepID=UPI0022F0FD9A|nr:ATP-binding cassette domain-containing protein [Paracoccus aerodenitrificans]WBU64259.1 ATP-binding cassette domain-containing protein [Paracoccus aerodenitrificans]